MNGDGKLDLLLTACVAGGSCFDSNTGVVAVRLGNGDGTFQSAHTYSSGGFGPGGLVAADVNGDGHADLVIGNFCADPNNCGCDSKGVVAVLLGNGDGTFQSARIYDSGGHGGEVIAKDLNGDAKPDIVVANGSTCQGNGTVGVLIGNGDGTFKPVQSYDSGGEQTIGIAVADINGDHKFDVLVGNGGLGFDGSSPVVGVLLGNGDGTFQSVRTFPGGTVPLLADLNQDGKLDLVISTDCGNPPLCSKGGVSVLLGNGDGTFQSMVTYSSGGFADLKILLADVNRDGRPDLLVLNLSSRPNSNQGKIGVLLGQGDGTLSAVQSVYLENGGSFNRGWRCKR